MALPGSAGWPEQKQHCRIVKLECSSSHQCKDRRRCSTWRKVLGPVHPRPSSSRGTRWVSPPTERVVSRYRRVGNKAPVAAKQLGTARQQQGIRGRKWILPLLCVCAPLGYSFSCCTMPTPLRASAIRPRHPSAAACARGPRQAREIPCFATGKCSFLLHHIHGARVCRTSR